MDVLYFEGYYYILKIVNGGSCKQEQVISRLEVSLVLLAKNS